jgi:hypothetical protein
MCGNIFRQASLIVLLLVLASCGKRNVDARTIEEYKLEVDSGMFKSCRVIYNIETCIFKNAICERPIVYFNHRYYYYSNEPFQCRATKSVGVKKIK